MRCGNEPLLSIVTTVEDEGSVEETRHAWLQMKLELTLFRPYGIPPRLDGKRAM